MGVEVADVGHHRVAVCHVGGVIPPLCDPIAYVGVLPPRDQALLEGLTRSTGGNEFVDGLCSRRIFGLGEQRVDGFEVSFCGFFEGGDGQTGEGVLEAQHGAFAVVLLVACAPSAMFQGVYCDL